MVLKGMFQLNGKFTKKGYFISNNAKRLKHL